MVIEQLMNYVFDSVKQALRISGDVNLTGSGVTLPTYQDGARSPLTYEFLPSLAGLLWVRGTSMYRRNGTKLEKSTDYGVGWTTIKDFAPNTPWYVWKDFANTSNNTLLVWVAAVRAGPFALYRSTDDATFASVLDPCYPPYGTHSGVAKTGNVIVYSEYVPDNTDHRILRSADDGATWTVTKTNTSAMSRHFHNTHYHTFRDMFIVTTGDLNANIHYYYSQDAGVTWNEFQGVNWDQRHRTVHLEFYGNDTLLWPCDGNPVDYCGVYMATFGTLHKPRLVLPLTDEAVFWHRFGNLVLAGTSVPTNNQTQKASMYVSVDGGQTWHRDQMFDLSAPTAMIGTCLGRDDQGRIYALPTNVNDGVSGLRITAKPGVVL